MSVIETDVAAVKMSDAGATSHINNYRILSLLGEGAFSRVYECENGDGHRFALKVLNKSFLKRKREYKRVDGKLVLSNAFQKVQKEVAIMKKLSHAHLVKLHEVIDSPTDDKMFLVLDLIRGGQVMDWDDKSFCYRSSRTPTGVLGRATVRACLRDVVAALDYLHRNRICHRDIKPENILLSSAEEGYKLADFGVAHMLEPEDEINRDQSMLRSTEGTYHFLAPECTTGEAYDPFQVDIWALGVTMFAMLKGTLPFGAKAASLDAVMTSIREDALVLPDDLAPECTELLARMLTKSPSERITIPQLLTHPWLWNDSAIPPTPRGGDDGDDGDAAQEEEGVVQVSAIEIEAAFTPINNFILMTKLKMKMGSRLARVRKSIDNRQEVVGNGGAPARRMTQQHSPTAQPQAPHHRSSDSAIVSVSFPLSDTSDVHKDATEDDAKEEAAAGDAKLCEVSPSETSSGKRAALHELQKRKSNVVETLNRTMDALASLKPVTMLRRNSALAASPTMSKAGVQSILLASNESALLTALPSYQLGRPYADPNAERGSVVGHLEAPTQEVVSSDGNSVLAVPDTNSTADSSHSAVGLATDTAVDKDPADSQPPIAPQSQHQQPRHSRQSLPRRSSTVAARIGETSNPTIRDISDSGALVRRKSAQSVLTSTHNAGGNSRSRSGSPSKTARLGRLEMVPDKVDHQQLAGGSPALQQPCDGSDAREEASGASTSLSSANVHEDDDPKLDANADAITSHATRTLAALTMAHEAIDNVAHSLAEPTAGGDSIRIDGEGDLSLRPQSPTTPRSRRRSSAHSSHPTLQAKLPPLNLSSAPSTPTTRSPTASPVAAGSPKRSRRASVDFPLRMNDIEELSTVDEGLPLQLPPGRRHSLLERPSAFEHHALPASAGPPSALSMPSSPRADAFYHLSEAELSLESSRSGEDDKEANVSAQPLTFEGEEASATDHSDERSLEGTIPPSRHASRPVEPSTSLSTPHLPRYHSPIRSELTKDGLHRSTLESKSHRSMTSSSSTGSLFPHHKLPPPTRFQAVPLIRDANGDRPSSPTDPTASIVRMSSLAKALDNCQPPEDNAAYYSFHSTPQMQAPVDPTTQEPSVEVVVPVVDDEVPLPKRRNSSHRRSLLEAQDSLKLMTRRNSAAHFSPSSRPTNVLERLRWRSGGGVADPPRTSVCVLM